MTTLSTNAAMDPETATAPDRAYPGGGFRALWSAVGASQVGSAVSLVTIPLIAVVSLGATAGQMSWLVAAGIIPALLVRLPAATWSDGLRHRVPAMIACNAAQAATIALVPVLWWLGALTLPALLLLVAAASALAAVYASLSSPVLVDVVPREHLVDANGKLSATRSVADINGPALAGGLLSVIAAPFVVLADAVSFLASALLLTRVRTGRVAPSTAQSSTQDTSRTPLPRLAGTMVGQAGLRLVVTVALVNGIVETVLVLFMARDLHLRPAVISILIGLGAVGGIGGGLLVGRLLGRFGPTTTLAVGAVSTIASLALVPFGQPGVLGAVSVVVFELTGSLGGTLMIATVFGTLQATAVPGEIARVMGLAGVFLQLAALAGAPLGGVLGTVFGPRTTLTVALLLIVAGLLPQLLRWWLSARSPDRGT